jgi:hypothetical protein
LSNSIVVYRGQTKLKTGNGRVFGALTYGTSNPKTGNMVQLWILSPIERWAISRAQDKSATCGNCPLKQACYVSPMGPESVRRGVRGKRANLKRGIASLAGQYLRLGAAGEPTALPIAEVKAMAQSNLGWTGYTHQWAHVSDQWASLLMASVETLEQRLAAKANGWRTFRVTKTGEASELQSGEIWCPSLKGVTCADCGLCCGTSRKAKDIAIPVHGARAKNLLAILDQ